MAYLPISYESINYENEKGEVISLEGKEAIDYKKSVRSKYDGEISAKKLYLAVEKYQKTFKENSIKTENDIPLNIYTEEISEIKSLVSKLPEVYADSKTGIGVEVQDISLDQIDQFYNRCSEHLTDIIKLENSNDQKTQEKAERMYSEVKQPYELYGGFSRDAFDYIVLQILILVIICTAIAAPTFSENYQNGSDSIFRTTEKGRLRLVITKILALLSIFTVYYLLCMSFQVTILNWAFGAECLKTSVQMLFSVISLIDCNLGTLQILTIAGGLLSLFAMISFTLFLSSRSRTPWVSMLIAILICLAPSIIYAIAGNNLISYIWPSSGIGMQNNFLYQLVGINFIKVGSIRIWSANIILLVSIIEFLGFGVLTIRNYCKHEVV